MRQKSILEEEKSLENSYYIVKGQNALLAQSPWNFNWKNPPSHTKYTHLNNESQHSQGGLPEMRLQIISGVLSLWMNCLAEI